MCVFPSMLLFSVNNTAWASFLISTFGNAYTYGCAIFISLGPNHGHLGCFPRAATANHAAVNILLKDLL